MVNPDESLRVLIIDDDELLAETLAESLERRGHACTVVTSGRVGLTRLESDEYDIVLTDLKMAEIDGLEVVRRCKQLRSETEVFVITGYGDVKSAVEAMKLGAAHYLQKPIDLSELRAVVDHAAERIRTVRELRRQLDEKFGFEGVVGNSPKMEKVLQHLRAYAPTTASVLILGENGTGKELVARALHANSPRRNKPFVAMNCAALNENLLDDEMFGHEEGAFTGAKAARKGRFEYAHTGTLFLDEIGDMPLSLQAKLLRVLENGEVVRIGANTPIRVDVRIIAATNKDLQQEVKAGRFRQDLFFRLQVGVIRLPALRERKEDIPLLGAHFLKELSKRHGKPIPRVAPAVWKAFESYDWPGNVRELKNLLENMLLLDLDGQLTLEDIPDDYTTQFSAVTFSNASSGGADSLIGKPLEEVERYYILKALELTQGNREEAARRLGIGERTLYRKLQQWKMSPVRKELSAVDPTSS
jgi:two-component system response regulator HydG